MACLAALSSCARYIRLSTATTRSRTPQLCPPPPGLPPPAAPGGAGLPAADEPPPPIRAPGPLPGVPVTDRREGVTGVSMPLLPEVCRREAGGGTRTC